MPKKSDKITQTKLRKSGHHKSNAHTYHTIQRTISIDQVQKIHKIVSYK